MSTTLTLVDVVAFDSGAIITYRFKAYILVRRLPFEHAHSKLPTVFVHSALEEQLFVPSRHSFKSLQVSPSPEKPSKNVI